MDTSTKQTKTEKVKKEFAEKLQELKAVAERHGLTIDHSYIGLKDPEDKASSGCVWINGTPYC